MTKRPPVQRSIRGLRTALHRLRRGGAKIALVPTMGALHDGHLALVRAAKKRAKRVVVSIFVNPAQFAPNEDFSKYPRTFEQDMKALSGLGVDLVWAPTPAVMYPAGFSTRVAPAGPASEGLEDRFRPHFFGGVTTVVAKLFLQVAPDFAIFGEKDYQQLKVVTRMASDLDIPVKVIGIPTVRDKDGLARSSRNAYLSAENRRIAPTLYRVLKESAARIKSGEDISVVLEDGRSAIVRTGFALDYLEARNPETLAPVSSSGGRHLRLLVAAKIGQTRLIDNIGV